MRPIHFNPTSRISSAVWTACSLDFDAVARLKSSVRDSGEFIVIVAAVYQLVRRDLREGLGGLPKELTKSPLQHVFHSLLFSIAHILIVSGVRQIRYLDEHEGR